MNDEPRRTLRELIARHGPGLCSDARRFEGLLRDLCGEHRREINILVGALRERVPLDLLAARNTVPAGLLLTRLAKRLEDQLALTGDASLWAVDSWALALGVVSDAGLDEIKSRRAEAERTRVEAAPPRQVEGGEAQPSARAADSGARAGNSAGGAADSGTRSPVSPPTTRQTPPAPATRTPTASSPAGPRPHASRATRTAAQGGANVAARRPPSPPAARTPSSPQAANTGGLQAPSTDATTRGGRRRWRGCLVGCFLIILLSALLFVGGPLVLNLLREEQQQRSLEPQPVQTH